MRLAADCGMRILGGLCLAAFALVSPVGCSSNVVAGDCRISEIVACTDPCTGGSLSATCMAGEWQCVVPASCSDCDAAVDCVDACGGFVPGQCIDGSWACPPAPGPCPLPPGGRARWSRSFGGDHWESAHDVAVDGDGNLVVVGMFTEVFEVGDDALVAAGGRDVYVVKLDPRGNLLWSLRHGGAGDDLPLGVGVDADGNVIVAGSSSTSIGNGPMAGPLFVLKLTPDAGLVFDKSFAVVPGMHHDALGVDAAGRIAIASHFSGTSDLGGPAFSATGNVDVFVGLLDADGNHLWSRTLGGDIYTYVEGVDLDELGNVFVTGTFRGSLPFAGDALRAATFDGFVVKLDDGGNDAWAHALSGGGSEAGARVVGYGDGGVALTAAFSNTVTLGSQSVSAKGARAALVARFDSAGGIHALRDVEGASETIDGFDRWRIAVDRFGNLVVAGQFEGATDIATPATSAGDYDIVLAKLSPDCEVVWGYTFGDSNSDIVGAVATSPTGDIALVGEFYGAPDLGNGSLESHSEGSVFVALFGPDGME